MKFLSEEDILKIASDVFSNNKGDVFYATQEGSFFEKRATAQKHADKIVSEVLCFERKQIENTDEVQTKPKKNKK